MFYSIMQCGRSIHFLRNFVAKMLRPERSEGAKRSDASCIEAEKSRKKFAAGGVALLTAVF